MFSVFNKMGGNFFWIRRKWKIDIVEIRDFNSDINKMFSTEMELEIIVAPFTAVNRKNTWLKVVL